MMEKELRTSGWYLSSDGISKCQEECREKGWPLTAKNVAMIALNCDLRAIGSKALSDDISRNLQSSVQGPLVLQVQKVKNVAVSSMKQHHASPSRRLLRIQLTDGHIFVSGVEIEGAIERVSPTTPPGTKVKLCGTITIKNSFLLLKKSSLEVLGGQVEHLHKKWQKVVPDNIDRSKAGGDSGPPQFTPFRESGASGSNIKVGTNRKSDAIPHKTQATKMQDRTSDRQQMTRPTQSLSTSSGNDRREFARKEEKISRNSDHGYRKIHSGGKQAEKKESSHREEARLHNQKEAYRTFPSDDKDRSSFQGIGRGGERQQHTGRGGSHGSRRSEGLGSSQVQRQTAYQDKGGHSQGGERVFAGGRGRGRGRPRHEQEDSYEPGRPKNSYNLADFFDEKLKLGQSHLVTEDIEEVDIGGRNERFGGRRRNYHTDHQSSRVTSTEDRRNSRRDHDQTSRDGHRNMKHDKSQFSNSESTARGKPFQGRDSRRTREAWVEEQHREKKQVNKTTTTTTTNKHSQGDLAQGGHWDWVSGSSGSSVPYSAKKKY